MECCLLPSNRRISVALPGIAHRNAVEVIPAILQYNELGTVSNKPIEILKKAPWCENLQTFSIRLLVHSFSLEVRKVRQI